MKGISNKKMIIYTLCDPNALKLEQEGYGYVVDSIGSLGGVVPYTAYNTRKSYLQNHFLMMEHLNLQEYSKD